MTNRRTDIWHKQSTDPCPALHAGEVVLVADQDFKNLQVVRAHTAIGITSYWRILLVNAGVVSRSYDYKPLLRDIAPALGMTEAEVGGISLEYALATLSRHPQAAGLCRRIEEYMHARHSRRDAAIQHAVHEIAEEEDLRFLRLLGREQRRTQLLDIGSDLPREEAAAVADLEVDLEFDE